MLRNASSHTCPTRVTRNVKRASEERGKIYTRGEYILSMLAVHKSLFPTGPALSLSFSLRINSDVTLLPSFQPSPRVQVHPHVRISSRQATDRSVRTRTKASGNRYISRLGTYISCGYRMTRCRWTRKGFYMSSNDCHTQ